MPKTDNAWLKTSNAAYAFISIIILAIAVMQNTWSSFPLSSAFLDVTFTSGFLALISLLYSLMSFRFIVAIKPNLAGQIGTLLFAAVAASTIVFSHNPEVYLGLWILVLITSGMSGWLMWTAFFTLNSIYFVLLQADVLENHFSNLYVSVAATTLAVIIGMAMFLIDATKVSAKHRKKGQTSSIDSSQLTTDILINAITDGVAIIGGDGLIQVFNPSAQRITGWEGDEAKNLDHRSVLIFTDDNGTIYPDERNPISQAIAHGKPFQDTNARLQSRSKKNIEIDIIASPIIDNGSTAAIITIFRDVSKIRHEERQRAEFISTASHEMRTPVAAIEGYLALALNPKVSKIDSAARSYLEKAHASTQHLGKLFQDLLTAAKSEDGRLTNNPAVVEVGQMLDELIEGVQFTAEKKGLMMKSDFGDASHDATAGATLRPVAYVYADPERLREVITNLFDNAVKYTEEGSITIGMHSTEKEVTIDISDTGAGIPKEDIPHLFQKFYRVDNTATRQIGGTGLGLFISRKIIELYNGRIWVESEVGKGSIFHIILPRLSAERAQELLKQEAQQQYEATDLPTIEAASDKNVQNEVVAAQGSAQVMQK